MKIVDVVSVLPVGTLVSIFNCDTLEYEYITVERNELLTKWVEEGEILLEIKPISEHHVQISFCYE